MGILNVNPQAEASTSFEAVKPGTYRMRIREVIDRNPEKNDLRVSLEHVTPATELVGVSGEALKGAASGLFDYIMLDFDKQWKLRAITEAAGLPWEAYDPVTELIGRELDVVIKIEVYEGEQRNKVARYVVPKE